MQDRRVRPTVLVVGASRGIGLEFVRQYLADGWAVHATTRTPEAPGVLGEFVGDLHLHALDVRSTAQLADLTAAVADPGLDVAIHNAGVGFGTSRREMIAVNAEAPIRTVESLLEAGAMREGGRVALLTSQMGARTGRGGRSLGDYGDSKAALNDEFRRRASAWGRQGVVAVVLHPGWVQTDMGGRGAPLRVEQSVTGMRRLLDELTDEQHGRFWTWDGREHPW